MAYLRSGRRRDICAILYGTDGYRAQSLKTALEGRYDTRLTPKTFHGALDKLVDAGHLQAETQGIHDTYTLTEQGKSAFEEHYQWLTEQMEGEK